MGGRHVPIDVRKAFAHEATVVLEPDGDVRALGAAITLELCGCWEHEPPCPLAPHHTASERDGDEVRLRVLFATEPETESEVRRRIDVALAQCALEGPDGSATHWHLISSCSAQVREEEAPAAARLIAG